MSEIKRAALYARVSTKGQTPESQLADLRAYCLTKGWIIQREFVDHGISGATADRPALKDLMAEARRHRFQVILVWSYSRFARSLTHLVHALEEFRVLGLDFVSIKEAVDTSTASGRLLFNIIGCIDEFQREINAERVASGLAVAKKKLARGPYRRMRDGKPITITHLGRPRKPVDLAEAKRMREAGHPWRAIAACFGVSIATIRSRVNGESGSIASPVPTSQDNQTS